MAEHSHHIAKERFDIKNVLAIYDQLLSADHVQIL